MEAMAQFAGGLAFQSGAQGFLTGIDACELMAPIVAGDLVTVHVTMEAGFGGIFRFSGSASRSGVEVARGRFYLAAGSE